MRRLVFSLALCIGCVWAQTSAPRNLNVAVLPFQGSKTVEPEQLDFITGKFTSELIHSSTFVVLDRGRMNEILKEQGFQQSGACNNSQCQVQMGQLLGVDDMISGNLVQFGGQYAFHLEMVDVGSGRIVKSIDLAEKGTLEDVYAAFCEKGAQALVQKENPHTNAIDEALPKIESHNNVSHSTRKKIALALMGSSLVGVGLGAYYNQQAVNDNNAYNAEINSTSPSQSIATQDYNNIGNMKTNRTASYSGAGILALAGVILWFLP